MESQSNSGRGPSRRTVLKGAVGVGVGATVWSSPSVHGIARTPAFAQAGSVNCQSVNSFQWNTSANPPGGEFGWNGQPCSGSNNSPYTVDPTGGTSVCAGAWGDASVTLTGDITQNVGQGNQLGNINIQINDTLSLSQDCYIVQALTIRTNGQICNTTVGGVGLKTMDVDMSCVTSANKRIDIEIECLGGLGC